MGLGARRYCDLYTWSHGLTEHVMAHTDGAVSVAILWHGLDGEFEDAAGRAQAWGLMKNVIAALPDGHWLECHLWRESSPGAVRGYLDIYESAPRQSPFSRAFRAAMADHVAPYLVTNSVALIVGCLPGGRHRLRKALGRQADQGQDLGALAARIAALLPGGRVATLLEYTTLIQKSYDRGRPITRIDPWLSLSEQIIAFSPRTKGRHIEVNASRVKVLYLHLYPQAEPAWILSLASGPVRLHVSQVVLAADTEHALRASERADRLAHGTMGHKGRERQSAIVQDMQGFRQTVAQSDLSIHRNAYVICIEFDESQRFEIERLISRIESLGGRIRDDKFIQLPFFRTSQPGQGYRSPLWRPDHSTQIVNMAPVQVFRAGSIYPESLRIGLSGQAVAFDYGHQTVAHGFTVAMTGAGKGVDKVATIAETYPLGIDWYVLEIGGTYRWVVEALGGTYTRLDPSAAAVNPLPPRSAGVSGLDPMLESGTLNILAFILTDGRTVLDFHEAAAGASALGRLYLGPATRDPGLVDFLKSLESLSDVSSEQRQAAQKMSANLHSFLETPEGRIFAGADNIQVSAGMSGIDLRDVDRASPKLLTFYLVFLCLRFLNLAFANAQPTRVLLDEIHRLVAHAPEVLRRLVSEIARMGRKEAAAIDIVTQGLAEIDSLEKEIVNSMPLRSLLYRSDGWDEIAERIGMPAQALSIWRRLPFPLGLPWRPAIRSVGHHYYALKLSFPPLVLALADTTPEGLARKESISRETTDPLVRIARFLDGSHEK